MKLELGINPQVNGTIKPPCQRLTLEQVIAQYNAFVDSQEVDVDKQVDAILSLRCLDGDGNFDIEKTRELQEERLLEILGDYGITLLSKN